jgi:tRNA (guanine37-N1)-methyltransferase
MMRIDVITLFPQALEMALTSSVLGRGKESRLFDIRIINLRDFATDKHQTVDDTRFGGGGGMLLKPEPLAAALDSLEIDYTDLDREKTRILLTAACGRPFQQDMAIKMSLLERLVIICGHYKGVDERILQLYPIDEISIGDFVLTGGEPAAWVIIDAVLRLIPGVMGNFESAIDDSFTQDQLLGGPDYTRPAEFRGLAVPKELMSGNHEEIRKFRRKMALEKTHINRPDLLEKADLTEEDIELLKKIEDSK